VSKIYKKRNFQILLEFPLLGANWPAGAKMFGTPCIIIIIIINPLALQPLQRSPCGSIRRHRRWRIISHALSEIWIIQVVYVKSGETSSLDAYEISQPNAVDSRRLREFAWTNYTGTL